MRGGGGAGWTKVKKEKILKSLGSPCSTCLEYSGPTDLWAHTGGGGGVADPRTHTGGSLYEKYQVLTPI